jgi:hypothetical protein
LSAHRSAQTSPILCLRIVMIIHHARASVEGR